MPLDDVIFSEKQINIPKELPDLLKQYTKAAIRTQPPDMLQWSAAYFTSLANGEPLPVKRRLEPFVENGLTIGNLEVLVGQYKAKSDVNVEVNSDDIAKKWADLGLPSHELGEISKAGGFGRSFNFDHFVGVACSHLGGSQIGEALKLICQLLTTDLAGYAERVDFARFSEIYKFLANLGGIPQAQVDVALQYLQGESEKQGGMVMPRNINSTECPSLG